MIKNDDSVSQLSSALIKAKAKSLGFDDCGISPAGEVPHFSDTLQEWISHGRHAGMHFMEENLDKRCNPQKLLPGAQSIISVVVGYKPSDTMQGPVRIARYAYGEDYHEKIKRMLFALIAAIKEDYPDFEAKPCVDTVPISDKYWAYRSGLGWIGKNTLLVTPNMGSMVNIGELVTTAPFDHYDRPIPNRCGDCTLCLKTCPNHALADTLDCRRCNAYNTIENRSETLPPDLRLNGYAFGCDCCQQVCPYNIQAEPRIQISSDRLQTLESLPQATEPEFKQITKQTALNRIKYPQWRRNVEKIRQN